MHIVIEFKSICLVVTTEYLVTFQDLRYLNFGEEVNHQRLCYMEFSQFARKSWFIQLGITGHSVRYLHVFFLNYLELDSYFKGENAFNVFKHRTHKNSGIHQEYKLHSKSMLKQTFLKGRQLLGVYVIIST